MKVETFGEVVDLDRLPTESLNSFFRMTDSLLFNAFDNIFTFCFVAHVDEGRTVKIVMVYEF